MDTKKIAKMTSLFESGLLSAQEWANSLLYDLVSAPELDTAFVSFLDSLPHEVGQEFRQTDGEDRAGRFPLDAVLPDLLDGPLVIRPDSPPNSGKSRRYCGGPNQR